MPAPHCFVCGGGEFGHLTREYRRCCRCGHEELVASSAQSFIVNDVLSAAAVRRPSFLDRFQGAVLQRWSPTNRGRLVDVGSGAGKFLHHYGRAFREAYGIEITPEVVNFSRNTLGLKIVADIREVDGAIDAVTAWHSLEHFPSSALTALLSALAEKLALEGRIIVSVPNADSFQYHLFRRHYAFFDVPSHLHQFTPASLSALFAHHGFVRTRAAISWPYNVFGYAQALLNCVIRPHNYFYYRVKRGRTRSVARDLATAVLLPLALPLAIVGGCWDAVFPARQGVLTWCFQKRP